MAAETRNIPGSIKSYKTANIRKPGPKIITLPAAGGTINSLWEETPDFTKIVGLCFTATSASLIVPITSASVGDKFYITGSEDAVYTYSASLNATASMNMEITSASLGDKFYISSSDGTVYTYSASMDVTASLDVTITSASLGAQFYITESGGVIYTFSASLDATASMDMEITSASLGDKFYITESDGTVYTFSASLDSTASMDVDITSASLGDSFYITGSGGTVYTFSASLDSTASLDYTITTASLGDKFYISSSLGVVYTYSASGGPVPADANPVFYFATGSDNDGTVDNLKDEINISYMSGSISASAVTSVLTLRAKNTGSAGNSITFQSGSTESNLTDGAAKPVDADPIFYFDFGYFGTLNTTVANLKDTINRVSVNTFISSSAVAAAMRLDAVNTGSAGNLMGFQSGSTQELLIGGLAKPIDADPIFYFDFGYFGTLATTILNLNNTINRVSVNTFVSSRATATEIWLDAVNTGSAGNLIGFQSGSTQEFFIGGSSIPIDADPIFYFDIGSGSVVLATAVSNLRDEINRKSTVNNAITASSATSTLSLFATTFGSIGNSIGFQSGSIQNLLTGGTSKPVDSYTDYIYYFDLGSGTAINTTTTNLKDEINNSDVSASVTGSTVTNTLYLWTKNPAVSGSWSFISGSTRDWFVGGDIVPADSGNVFYFDIGVGGVLATASLNLKDEINNSTANAFITASIDTFPSLSLFTTVAESIGIPPGFQSGSTQYKILQSDSGSGGTLYIHQAPFTASVDYSGSAIAIGDSNGMEFSQNLYSGYVRLRYVQTGSIAPNFLRIYSYLVP